MGIRNTVYAQVLLDYGKGYWKHLRLWIEEALGFVAVAQTELATASNYEELRIGSAQTRILGFESKL